MESVWELSLWGGDQTRWEQSSAVVMKGLAWGSNLKFPNSHSILNKGQSFVTRDYLFPLVFISMSGNLGAPSLKLWGQGEISWGWNFVWGSSWHPGLAKFFCWWKASYGLYVFNQWAQKRGERNCGWIWHWRRLPPGYMKSFYPRWVGTSCFFLLILREQFSLCPRHDSQILNCQLSVGLS